MKRIITISDRVTSGIGPFKLNEIAKRRTCPFCAFRRPDSGWFDTVCRAKSSARWWKKGDPLHARYVCFARVASSSSIELDSGAPSSSESRRQKRVRETRTGTRYFRRFTSFVDERDRDAAARRMRFNRCRSLSCKSRNRACARTRATC